MINFKITNARTPHLVLVIPFTELDDEILRNRLKFDYPQSSKRHTKSNGVARRMNAYEVGEYKFNRRLYLEMHCGFDIETTLADDNNSYMWIWQFSISEKCVIIGRTWNQFISFLDMLKRVLHPSKSMRLIVGVQNLGYEWQFAKYRLNVTDAFFKDERSPLYVEHDNFIQFRDTLVLTNMSLANIAKTYTNTQKAVGDLDYSIKRSSKYPILDRSPEHDQELQYCINDVLIISEYMRSVFDKYIKRGFLPLTQTGILRYNVKQTFASLTDDEKALYGRQKPKNEQEYNILMNWIYRGGYVHANVDYVGETYLFNDGIINKDGDRLYCVDYTSSYPARIFYYYPTRFRDADPKDIERDLEEKCIIMRATFRKIRAKTSHTIESQSKCIRLEGALIDNGRIESADMLTVWLTELDYKNYVNFYEWDGDPIIDVYQTSPRQICPRYLVDNIIGPYIQKAILKEEGKPYANEKAVVNSAYGLCVQRIPVQNVIWTGDGFETKPCKSIEYQVSKNVLSPYIGVWISAHARHELLQCVYDLQVGCNADVLYCDTDSIKFIANDNAIEYIKRYNDNIGRLRDQAMQWYQIPDDQRQYMYDLGMFDREYGKDDGSVDVVAFRTLGAKRYILVYRKNDRLYVNQTVAGLPKGILFDHIPKDGDGYRLDQINDIMEVVNRFDDGITVEDCKLTHTYNDSPSSTYIDGVYMFEYSNISLIESNFTLKLNDDWVMNFLQSRIDDNLERRIL